MNFLPESRESGSTHPPTTNQALSIRGVGGSEIHLPKKNLDPKLAAGKRSFVGPTQTPLWDIPSGCCLSTGPWTVPRSSLHMLRQVAAFCQLLWPVLLLVSFLRSWSPVVGVLGLCWMWHGVPFACQRCPVVDVLGLCWLLWGSFDCFCCPRTSVLRPSTTCLSVFLCA